MITPEVREALEGTLLIAQQNALEAQKRYNKYLDLVQQADADMLAAHQTIAALRATLGDEPQPDQLDFRTFGDE